MTAKRFIIMDNLPKGTHSSIWDKQKQHNQGIGDELWLGEVVAMLNEGVIIAEENEQLKSALKELKYIGDYQAKRINELSDENEQLKKALWCIRKRYGYTVEEFVEDLKDNGIDLSKVDLE